MVVIHRRSNHGRIYHCKKIIFLVEKQKRKGNLYSCYIVQPFSSILNGRMGSGVGTIQLMKMVAGVINPGRPVANLYVSSSFVLYNFSCRLSLISRKKFSMWSHDVISTSLTLAADLKIGQYLKIPPRVMFLTQVWGTLIG